MHDLRAFIAEGRAYGIRFFILFYTKSLKKFSPRLELWRFEVCVKNIEGSAIEADPIWCDFKSVTAERFSRETSINWRNKMNNIKAKSIQ